jgi:hypothetical protein
MAGRRKVLFPEESFRPMVRLCGEAKAVLSPALGAQEICQPQPKDPLQKRAKTAPPGQRQLPRIKGAHGLLNPEEGLLVDVVQLPGSKSITPHPAGEVGWERVPVPARQFIARWLTLGLPRQQKENFVARVRQIQEPALLVWALHRFAIVGSVAVRLRPRATP